MTLQQQADVSFMALCLWREARGERSDGKAAVGFSIMNRVAHRSWGNTVMAVIFQRLQYSSLTYSADPQLANWPKDNDPSWAECLEIADQVMANLIPNPIDGADSYHDTSISPPKWATPDNFVGQIGRLRFYQVGA
jgi:spore germination cell wall hydrolase CwlJ-like protein